MFNQEIFENLLASLAEKGINLGGRIIALIIILLVGLKLVKIAQRILNAALNKANADKSVATFLNSLVRYGLYGILAFIIASYCGVDAASIVALVGSIGVAVGLALQGSLSNIAGGVLILLLRPFKVGDYIISGGNEGVVTDIDIFFTTLTTGDSKTIILPNGALANGSIINASTTGLRRCDITVGISYNADIDKAKAVIMNILDNDKDILHDKDKLVFVSNLGASSVDLGVRCWFDGADYWTGLWRLNETVKKELDKNDIEIPYNQLDVHIKEK